MLGLQLPKGLSWINVFVPQLPLYKAEKETGNVSLKISYAWHILTLSSRNIWLIFSTSLRTTFSLNQGEKNVPSLQPSPFRLSMTHL